MRSPVFNRRGQALVMVALAAVAMFAVIGLAVDVGWSFYVRKQARSAADAAALAAVKASYASIRSVLTTFTYDCTTGACHEGAPCMACASTPQTCGTSATTGSNLATGCEYAGRNGFRVGGRSGRQTVQIQADVTSPFQTRTGPVTTYYWVTAIVSERVPQLFSAVFGNKDSTVVARSTAAIVDMEVPGSLILLNRQKDKSAMGNVPGGNYQYGLNLLVQANDNQGHYALQTAGGIRMASQCGSSVVGSDSTTCSNGGNQMYYAGENLGGGTVYSPDIRIRSDGWVDTGGSAKWLPDPPGPRNGYSSGFDDPQAGKGLLPPAPSQASISSEFPVPGGTIDAAFCQGINPGGGYCPSGKYYSTSGGAASGAPLQLNGNVTFGDGGAASFGNFVFYGGLMKGNKQTTATFNSGMYVLAGALPTNNGPGVLLDTSTNFTMRDATASWDSDGSYIGELFVMTDGTYNGGITPPATQWTPGLESSLKFGTANFQAGANGTNINLHGLNTDLIPDTMPSLQQFGGVLLWWDRRNTWVKHDPTGNVDISSCGAGHDLNNPCTNEGQSSFPDMRSAELSIDASPNVHLYGVISQPRGAWTAMIGGGGYAGPIQLITGAIQVKGNSNVNLTVPHHKSIITVCSLIE